MYLYFAVTLTTRFGWRHIAFCSTYHQQSCHPIKYKKDHAIQQLNYWTSMRFKFPVMIMFYRQWTDCDINLIIIQLNGWLSRSKEWANFCFIFLWSIFCLSHHRVPLCAPRHFHPLFNQVWKTWRQRKGDFTWTWVIKESGSFLGSLHYQKRCTLTLNSNLHYLCPGNLNKTWIQSTELNSDFIATEIYIFLFQFV